MAALVSYLAEHLFYEFVILVWMVLFIFVRGPTLTQRFN